MTEGEEYRLARQYALRRLSAQSLPAAVLSKSLRQRQVSEETIDKVISELCQQGYINDHEWTQAFVRGQLSRKRGPREIMRRLSAKGISTEQADAALEAVGINHEDQEKSISELLSTRYRNKNLKDFKERQKVVASLLRRGFDFEIVINLLRKKQE